MKAQPLRRNKVKRKLTISRPELITNGGDGEFRSLVHNLLSFGWHIEAIRDGLGGSVGLSGIQYTMLTAIAHLQGEEGVSVQDVARHLHMSGSFVTMETAKLAEANLVQKRQDSVDRRRVRLTLSDRGVKLLEDITSIQVPVNDTLFGSLSAEDFAALSRIAVGLAESAERAQVLLDFLKRAQKPRRRAG